MAKTYLCLGSNLGDRKQNIKKALGLLAERGIRVIKTSSMYETEPVGFKLQPLFYNICVETETNIEPDGLLGVLQEIEVKTGRKKAEKWGPRIIDIDILFYNNIIIYGADLVIPHPEIQNRKFVLAPMAEIAGSFVHPGYNLTIKEMLDTGNFAEKVKRLELKDE
jgi:dihydroneopterin aldolase / 2-amino-4-hydroxy-6-hydroxymethyldihydropteridine diphosphokinase